MAYSDRLEVVRAALEMQTGYPALLDMHLTTKRPPVWYVIYDGMDFTQPRNSTKLQVLIVGVGGFIDEAGSYVACADMAYKAVDVVKGLGFNIEAGSIFDMPWNGETVLAFNTT